MISKKIPQQYVAFSSALNALNDFYHSVLQTICIMSEYLKHPLKSVLGKRPSDDNIGGRGKRAKKDGKYDNGGG
jgi:hypothetical protein